MPVSTRISECNSPEDVEYAEFFSRITSVILEQFPSLGEQSTTTTTTNNNNNNNDDRMKQAVSSQYAENPKEFNDFLNTPVKAFDSALPAM